MIEHSGQPEQRPADGGEDAAVSEIALHSDAEVAVTHGLLSPPAELSFQATPAQLVTIDISAA